MSQISVTSEELAQEGRPVTPPQTPQPKSKWRWLKRLLLAMLTLVVVALLALVWLTKTESGLRFTLFRIPAWFGVDISADKVSGNVWGGFKGEKWVIKTEGANIKSAVRY